MDTARFAILLERYEKNAATSAEEAELIAFFADPQTRDDIAELLTHAIALTPEDPVSDPTHWQSIIDRILGQQELPDRIIPMGTGWGKRIWWAAVAAILLLLGATTWIWIEKRSAPPIANHQPRFGGDIAPPSAAMAVLTLASGQKIALDRAGNGTLARQGQVRVVKLANGQIAYTGHGEEVMYNTITNPRGSQVVNLTLNDGTKVWLNAESSLRYPVIFTGQDRMVEVTGEGYFEVAQNPNRPFKVQQAKTTIEVLGTAFNVNAYADESALKVTLLDGKVRVEKERNNIVLQPGQQAQVATDIQLNKGVDLVAVMAWKNGRFAFKDADLPTVMRQLARWYNVDVTYEGDIPKREFNGKIGKTLTLAQVLKVLAKTRVNYTIEGKKLTIRP